MNHDERNITDEQGERQVFWAVTYELGGRLTFEVDPIFGETLWPSKEQALQALRDIYEDEDGRPWTVRQVVKVTVELAEEESRVAQLPLHTQLVFAAAFALS